MVVPEPLVLREPLPHRPESSRNKTVVVFSTMPSLRYQSGVEQNTQVLRDSRPTHLEILSHRVDRAVRPRELIEHVPPCRMADRGKHVNVGLVGS